MSVRTGKVCRLFGAALLVCWPTVASQGTLRASLEAEPRERELPPGGCQQSAPFGQEYEGTGMGTLNQYNKCKGYPEQVCPPGTEG